MQWDNKQTNEAKEIYWKIEINLEISWCKTVSKHLKL